MRYSLNDSLPDPRYHPSRWSQTAKFIRKLTKGRFGLGELLAVSKGEVSSDRCAVPQRSASVALRPRADHALLDGAITRCLCDRLIRVGLSVLGTKDSRYMRLLCSS